MNRTRALSSAAVFAVVASTAVLALQSPASAETRPICFPVAGGPSAVSWTDTFGAPRGGGTRSHEGQDLMGPKGTVLLSAVDGVVREIVHNNAKGNRLVIEDDDGWYYVYLHLNNDTPGTDDGAATFDHVFIGGLEEGQRVSACEPVAYLGDSGNAEHTAPHLHFEIRRPLPPDHPNAGTAKSWAWSSATAINAADSLRAATTAAGSEPSGLRQGAPATAAPSGLWAPFASVDELVERQYLDFYGRAPDRGGARYWSGLLAGGDENPASFVAKLLFAPEFEARIAPVARLYWAYFGRIPDTAGLMHWIGESSSGTALGDISQAFAGSPEFLGAYGSLDHEAFVELVYENVLGRSPDAAGRRHWVEVLDAGRASRGGVMVGFSESPEYRAKLAAPVRVVLAYVAMLERSPDTAGLEHWVARGTDELVSGIYGSAEYASRIAGLRAGA